MRTKMMSMIILVGIILSFRAGATDTKPDGRCDSDIQTYCSQVTSGGNRIMDCLYQHQDKLSTECKEVALNFRQHQHQEREECRPDAEKFCPSIEHGGGRIRACLMEHLDELSPTCSENFEKEKVCKEDTEKYCPGFEHDHAQLMACYDKHKSELSDGCRKQVETAEQRHSSK